MMYRFSSFVLALLLLVASGQVMAATYFSNADVVDADFASGAAGKVSVKWNTDKCTVGAAAGTAAVAGTVIAAGDTFTICSPNTLALAADLALPTTGASAITVASGGTLTVATGKTLTIAANGGIVNNGTITLTGSGKIALSGATGGTYSGSGVLNSACTAAAATAWTTAGTWGTATSGCGVTVGTGTVPSPSAGSDVTIGAFAVTAGTGTVNSLTLSDTASRLTLSGPLDVTTNLVFGHANAILTATGQTITLGGDLTTLATANIVGSPNLTLTDAPHILTITAAAITLGTLTLTPPTATTTEIKISVVTSGINVTSSSLGVCVDASVGSTVNTPTGTTVAADDYFCKLAPVAPGVAAPIFSTKEKATVFSQELK